jgi:hypothetical protein
LIVGKLNLGREQQLKNTLMETGSQGQKLDKNWKQFDDPGMP